MCLRVNTPHSAILLLSVFFCLSHSASGQVISLNFARFAGKDWNLIGFRGDQQDTLLRGNIPPDGKVVLHIPEGNRSYSGMARWMLTDGGGLDFVLNAESFSVECLSDQPNESNIIYAGTTENTFLNTNHKEQEILLAKFEAVTQTLALYPDGSSLNQPLSV
jgi:hypothetical protein